MSPEDLTDGDKTSFVASKCYSAAMFTDATVKQSGPSPRVVINIPLKTQSSQSFFEGLAAKVLRLYCQTVRFGVWVQ